MLFHDKHFKFTPLYIQKKKIPNSKIQLSYHPPLKVLEALVEARLHGEHLGPIAVDVLVIRIEANRPLVVVEGLTLLAPLQVQRRQLDAGVGLEAPVAFTGQHRLEVVGGLGVLALEHEQRASEVARLQGVLVRGRDLFGARVDALGVLAPVEMVDRLLHETEVSEWELGEQFA